MLRIQWRKQQWGGVASSSADINPPSREEFRRSTFEKKFGVTPQRVVNPRGHSILSLYVGYSRNESLLRNDPHEE
ncbi:hypothetical protein ALC57_16768 [Trachymyrmex cornetzi]|uniref:Uncharacterized protein n=1 Tax=Trachymyrmex cornetzi TaxID=471704 RepID=A0A151IUH6_9HYME|nr:hypothetical protein ALC57_16768 [Trachymyrmex cornetzi]